MIKVVPDTNILVAGFCFPGPSRTLINLARANRIVLFGNNKSFDEFKEVVNREQFEEQLKRIILTPAKLVLEYENLVNLREMPEGSSSPNYCEDDPDDDKFIQIAKAANAKIIISQDNHLRKLKVVEGITIVTREIFIDKYKELNGGSLY